MDVVIVGAGPAGLSCAIALAQRVKQAQAAGEDVPDISIAVLDKAGSLGEHSLSGAVVNPRVFRDLFPDTALDQLPFRQPVTAEAVYLLTPSRSQKIPTPPTMHNAGFYTASLCEIVRWMGERAEELGVNRFSGRRALGGGRHGAWRSHHSNRSRSQWRSRSELSGADRHHRQNHGPG
jgi:electron-transferring-flavoprotein dehydrogenase